MLRALLCGCYAGCEPPAYQRPPVRACGDYPYRFVRVQGRFLTLYSSVAVCHSLFNILAPIHWDFEDATTHSLLVLGSWAKTTPAVYRLTTIDLFMP